MRISKPYTSCPELYMKEATAKSSWMPHLAKKLTHSQGNAMHTAIRSNGNTDLCRSVTLYWIWYPYTVRPSMKNARSTRQVQQHLGGWGVTAWVEKQGQRWRRAGAEKENVLRGTTVLRGAVLGRRGVWMAALALLFSSRCACCSPHPQVLRVLRRPCFSTAGAHAMRLVRGCCADCLQAMRTVAGLLAALAACTTLAVCTDACDFFFDFLSNVLILFCWFFEPQQFRSEVTETHIHHYWLVRCRGARASGCALVGRGAPSRSTRGGVAASRSSRRGGAPSRSSRGRGFVIDAWAAGGFRTGFLLFETEIHKFLGQ